MFDVAGTIPPELDDLEPGIQLAICLATVDVTGLSGHDRIVVLRAHQRMAAYYAAEVFRDMTAVSDWLHDLDDDPQLATESAAAEIRVALQLTRRAADSELNLALDLRHRLPRVWKLLAAGDIDVRRARTMVHATSHLPITAARTVIGQVIEAAPRLTTGQLTARIRRLCIDTNPDDATDRYREAVESRRVVTEPTPDGTTHLLGLDLPPHRVAAITRRLNQLAQSLRSTTEPRTMDQLRADVLLDLLDGKPTRTTNTRGSVDIHVDLTTLTELTNHAGELAGYGPVIADLARQITQDQPRAEWRYTITHPDTGQILHNGITRRRPTADQRRDVETHHPTCIFPGCRMPATNCDLDHRIPHAEGGPTITPNLAPLCRHDHHIIRHQAGWTHQPLPNGDHQWTTKLGHTYTTSGKPP